MQDIPETPTFTNSGQCSHLSCSSAVRGAILSVRLHSFAIARSSRTTSTSWSAQASKASHDITMSARLHSKAIARSSRTTSMSWSAQAYNQTRL